MSDRKQYFKELREWYLQHGICYTCKIREVEQGRTRCLICKMEQRELNKRNHERESAEQKQKNRIATNERKTRLRAEGLCVDCGKRPVVHGCRRCGICLEKDRQRQRERNQRAGGISRELRGNGLYCNMCCKPLCNGEKLCTECYKKACAALEIARSKVDRQAHPWRQIILNDVLLSNMK